LRKTECCQKTSFGEVGAITKLIPHDTELTGKEDSAAEARETDKARQMKAKFMLKIIFGYFFPFIVQLLRL
jgi:hypothetical protein